MKKIVASIFLCFLFCGTSISQELIIKGRIRCLNQNVKSTKGAENIVVVPSFNPSRAGITSSPPGYFQLNTGVPISKLQDKTITVYAVSRCSKCKEIAKRVFVSEDMDRKNKDDKKQYVTVKEWMLNAHCNEAELVPYTADSLLNIIVKEPGLDLNNVSPFTVLTGGPAFLNTLTNIITVVGGTVQNEGIFYTRYLDSGKIRYGQSLLASSLIHSANTGFNFSPARDISEAVFWNPSAIAHARKKFNFSLLTNIKNNVKAGGFAKVRKKISVGAGFIYIRQDEFRTAYFSKPNPTFIKADTAKMKLQEYAAFISPVFRFNNKLSASVTLKSVWQKFNYPRYGSFEQFRPSIIYYDTIKAHHLDIDFSATYKINATLQVGMNLMNLADKKLYAAAFKGGCPCEAIYQTQRSLGFGLTYKWRRFNAGSDLLFTEDGLYDASLGVNYVPFNNALLSAGFAIKHKSYSFAFRIKHFRLSYINDNGWLVNDERKGKLNILNGHLYGGFIFDFDGFKKNNL